MELFRALAALAEPPAAETRRLAALLELGPPPAAAEHAELFLFQLHPYASVYLGGEGMLGGEARDRVAGFWRALALEPPAEPDHLPVLLAFYAELSGREAAGGGSAGPWRRARAAFLWEHLLPWLPVYLAKLRTLASPFYRRWGRLLGRALAEEAARHEPPAELPLHLREAPPLPDPRTAGGEPFVAGLLAPVRSGLLLTRHDLARAATELELPVRSGDRRLALGGLLEQEPSATLHWLRAEAGRWVRRHQHLAAVTGSTAIFWVERATATSRLLRALAAE